MAKTIIRGAQVGMLAGFFLPWIAGAGISNLIAPMILGCTAGLAGGIVSAKSSNIRYQQECYDYQSEIIGRF